MGVNSIQVRIDLSCDIDLQISNHGGVVCERVPLVKQIQLEHDMRGNCFTQIMAEEWIPSKAISRLGFAPISFMNRGRSILRSRYWRAISNSYNSGTFLRGYQETGLPVTSR